MKCDTEPETRDELAEEACKLFVDGIYGCFDPYLAPKNPPEAPEIRENTK